MKFLRKFKKTNKTLIILLAVAFAIIIFFLGMQYQKIQDQSSIQIPQNITNNTNNESELCEEIIQIDKMITSGNFNGIEKYVNSYKVYCPTDSPFVMIQSICKNNPNKSEIDTYELGLIGSEGGYHDLADYKKMLSNFVSVYGQFKFTGKYQDETKRFVYIWSNLLKKDEIEIRFDENKKVSFIVGNIPPTTKLEKVTLCGLSPK